MTAKIVYRHSPHRPGQRDPPAAAAPRRGPGHRADSRQARAAAAQLPGHVFLAAANRSSADALVHFGTHGTEFILPGKATGLSDVDWPDILLGAMPNINPWIVDNLGESSAVRRRAYAVLIDHLVPPSVGAELSGGLRNLHNDIEKWDALDEGRAEGKIPRLDHPPDRGRPPRSRPARRSRPASLVRGRGDRARGSLLARDPQRDDDRQPARLRPAAPAGPARPLAGDLPGETLPRRPGRGDSAAAGRRPHRRKPREVPPPKSGRSPAAHRLPGLAGRGRPPRRGRNGSRRRPRQAARRRFPAGPAAPGRFCQDPAGDRQPRGRAGRPLHSAGTRQ